MIASRLGLSFGASKPPMLEVQKRTQSVGRRHFALPRYSEKFQSNERGSAPVRLSDLRKNRPSSAEDVPREQPEGRKRGKVEVEKPSQQAWEDRSERKVSASKRDGDKAFGATARARGSFTEHRGQQGSRKPFKWTRKKHDDPEKEYESAKASALRSLQRRLHSRHELREKLLEKEYAPEIADKAIDRLMAVELLDDALFAEKFAQSKWRQNKWAPSRISLELKRKGVSKADIDTGLEVVFGDAKGGIIFEPDDEPREAHDDSAGLDKQLLETVRRRQQQIASLPPEVQKRRLIAWLGRRGHSWSVSASLLAELGLMRY